MTHTRRPWSKRRHLAFNRSPCRLICPVPWQDPATVWSSESEREECQSKLDIGLWTVDTGNWELGSAWKTCPPYLYGLQPSASLLQSDMQQQQQLAGVKRAQNCQKPGEKPEVTRACLRIVTVAYATLLEARTTPRPVVNLEKKKKKTK